jgi:hypothetical protein
MPVGAQYLHSNGFGTLPFSLEPAPTATRRVRDHVAEMSAEKPDAGDGTGSGRGDDVMSSLPRTRPQRPSRRRASRGEKPKRAPAKPAAAKSSASGAGAKRGPKTPRAASAPHKPAGVRPSDATKAAGTQPSPNRPPSPPSGTDLIGTAVQAAGELAQLGLTLGTKALRDAVKRVPRP